MLYKEQSEVRRLRCWIESESDEQCDAWLRKMSDNYNLRWTAETEEWEARLTRMRDTTTRRSSEWSEPTGFNVEGKDKNFYVLQRQWKKEKRLRKYRMSQGGCSDCGAERGNVTEEVHQSKQKIFYRVWRAERGKATGDVYQWTQEMCCWDCAVKSRERQGYRGCIPVNILTLHRHTWFNQMHFINFLLIDTVQTIVMMYGDG